MSSKAIERLLTLAADAERAAASYRMAAAALNGHATSKRVARSATILDAALEIDAARRKTKPKQTRTGDHTRKIRAQRQRTAGYLAYLGKHGPLTAKAFNEAVGSRVGIAPLTNAGYIKAVGDKYTRTAKPFTVEAKGGR